MAVSQKSTWARPPTGGPDVTGTSGSPATSSWPMEAEGERDTPPMGSTLDAVKGREAVTGGTLVEEPAPASPWGEDEPTRVGVT